MPRVLDKELKEESMDDVDMDDEVVFGKRNVLDSIKRGFFDNWHALTIIGVGLLFGSLFTTLFVTLDWGPMLATAFSLTPSAGFTAGMAGLVFVLAMAVGVTIAYGISRAGACFPPMSGVAASLHWRNLLRKEDRVGVRPLHDHDFQQPNHHVNHDSNDSDDNSSHGNTGRRTVTV